MGPQGPRSLNDPIESPNPDPNQPYSQNVNKHVSSGWCVYSKFAYGEVKDPLKIYRGKDCVKKLCDNVKGEAHRLYHAFPEKPMEPLTKKNSGRNVRKRVGVTFALNHLRKIIQK